MSKDKPQALNLNDLIVAHEEKQRQVEPFILEGVGPDGATIEFRNPEDLDWEESQEVAQAINDSDLRQFFYIMIEDGDQLNAWFEARVPGPVASKVIEEYMKHHGWDLRTGRMNRQQRRANKRS